MNFSFLELDQFYFDSECHKLADAKTERKKMTSRRVVRKMVRFSKYMGLNVKRLGKLLTPQIDR